MKSIDTRLTALEKAVSEPGEKFLPQLVCYDLATGRPLVTPDPMAKQIWIGVTDEEEMKQVLLR